MPTQLLAVLLLLTVTTSTPAPRSPLPVPSSFFHARLKKSYPAANDTLIDVAELKFWFSERVELKFTRIGLFKSSGKAYELGIPTLADTAGAPVVVPIPMGRLGGGKYTVKWSTAADDGHPSKGEFSFVVK